MEQQKVEQLQKADFGAGCFWGVEARFQQVPGVVETAVGYEGGKQENPTYHDVCTDRTGHAEVVQVTFDPSKVSYQALLDLFFELHDPTQVNRQGPDWGTQYRTAVFVHSPEQEADARATIERLNASGRYKRPIATQVVPAATFWRAEEYHQKYLEKRGAVSCHI
jgi:peptide-methionine (S)-S-oxide reductase